MFPVSGDVDVFSSCVLSCTWYVLFFRSTRYKRVMGVNMNGITTPACSLRCRGRSCTLLYAWGPDLLLGHLNHFKDVGAASDIILPFTTEVFHPYSCIQGKYSILHLGF